MRRRTTHVHSHTHRHTHTHFAALLSAWRPRLGVRTAAAGPGLWKLCEHRRVVESLPPSSSAAAATAVVYTISRRRRQVRGSLIFGTRRVVSLRPPVRQPAHRPGTAFPEPKRFERQHARVGTRPNSINDLLSTD